MKRIILILIAMLLLATQGISQIINVPGDQPSIQSAIDAASNGDTVLVEENTYYENINFMGKPITVASRFILDGDTSHISRTIIDGSQSTKVDTGSVVLMNSLEDTTSVLMGFTITGGTGSVLGFSWWSQKPEWYLIGGGIAIVHAGGKIIHNIIEHNTVESWERYFSVMAGAGIFAIISNHRTAIIRDNIIRNNLLTSNLNYLAGGGAAFALGRLLVENNQFIGNTVNRPGTPDHAAMGGGFSWGGGQEFYTPDTIREVIFRNNVITHNQCFGNGDPEGGGGVALGNPNGESPVEFYNNVVAYNYASHEGGGVFIHLTDINFINNTIYKNQAGVNGNNLTIDRCTYRIFNNIIWSDTLSQEIRNIERLGTYHKVYYNLLSESFAPWPLYSGNGNSFLDPELESETLKPGSNSPAVGRGIDTMWIDASYYVAPATDINGDPRPSDYDAHVDIGAIESEYERYLFANADLNSLGMVGHSMVPQFHKDTLNYLLIKSPGTKVIGNWRIYTYDNLATVEMDTAANYLSENELDRTTTITVTSSDGTTKKEYTVIYQYLPGSDTTLANLEVSLGTLSPSFDSSIFAYYDTISYGLKIPTPEITCIATDTNSTVSISPAQDIYSQYEVMRTTTVYVTSPNGLFTKEYTILFTVDLTRPSLTLLNDFVEVGDSIGVNVSEPGTVYLVPENTPAIYDSISSVKLAWAESDITGNVFLPTESLEAGNYWLYTCGKHQSISESQEITIFADTSTIVSGFQNQSFRVYPNPTTDFLRIQTSEEDTYDILITTLEGHLVYRSNLHGKTNELDLSSFQKGVYLITIRSKDFVTTRRIIKL